MSRDEAAGLPLEIEALRKALVWHAGKIEIPEQAISEWQSSHLPLRTGRQPQVVEGIVALAQHLAVHAEDAASQALEQLGKLVVLLCAQKTMTARRGRSWQTSCGTAGRSTRSSATARPATPPS